METTATTMQLIDSLLNAERQVSPIPPAAEEEALDAYSRVVTSVAEALSPSVASLRVHRRGRVGRGLEGARRAVGISPHCYLLTSAHVVSGGDGGGAAFFGRRGLQVR